MKVIEVKICAGWSILESNLGWPRFFCPLLPRRGRVGDGKYRSGLGAESFEPSGLDLACLEARRSRRGCCAIRISALSAIKPVVACLEPQIGYTRSCVSLHNRTINQRVKKKVSRSRYKRRVSTHLKKPDRARMLLTLKYSAWSDIGTRSCECRLAGFYGVHGPASPRNIKLF